MTIRDYRKAKHLTIRQLSAICGVSPTQLQAVETGKASPGNMSARNLLAIARALEVDPFTLVNLSD